MDSFMSTFIQWCIIIFWVTVLSIPIWLMYLAKISRYNRWKEKSFKEKIK